MARQIAKSWESHTSRRMPDSHDWTDLADHQARRPIHFGLLPDFFNEINPGRTIIHIWN